MGEAKRRKLAAQAAGKPLEPNPPRANIEAALRRMVLTMPLSNPSTPRKPLSATVLSLCRRISAAEPVFLPYTDVGAGYVSAQCHVNVVHRVRTHGGHRINGWMIWEAGTFAEAEYHCVWQSPDGQLIDLTPRVDREERILFLPDPATRLTRGERGIMQPTNRNAAGGYTMMGIAYAHPTAQNTLNDRTRAYCERMGVDPFDMCGDEGLVPTKARQRAAAGDRCL